MYILQSNKHLRMCVDECHFYKHFCIMGHLLTRKLLLKELNKQELQYLKTNNRELEIIKV